MARERKVFQLDEAQATILIYNEDREISKEEFDRQVEAMRQGIREIEADAIEKEKAKSIPNQQQ